MCLTWRHTIILPMEICKSSVTLRSKLNMALPAFCDREFWEFTFVGMAFIASYNFSSKWIIKNALFLLLPIKMSNPSCLIPHAGNRILQEGTQQQAPSTAPLRLGAQNAPDLGDFSQANSPFSSVKPQGGEKQLEAITCVTKSNTPVLAGGGMAAHEPCRGPFRV